MLGINELWQQNKALWRECFHDDEAFIDLYFSRVARPKIPIIWKVTAGLLALCRLCPMNCGIAGRGVGLLICQV